MLFAAFHLPIIHHTGFWAAEMAPEERLRANTAAAPLQVHAFWGQGDKVNEADLQASTENKGLVRPYRGEEQGWAMLTAWPFSPVTSMAEKEGCLGS